MNIHILASGSDANCMLVQFDDTVIMIDAGLPAKKAFPRMLAAGVQPESISAVLITHAHLDHIQGLCGPKGIGAQLRLPIYMSYGAAGGFKPGEGWKPNLTVFEPGASFDVRGVWVETFPVPHDGPGTTGFVLSHGGERFALVTDAGAFTPTIEVSLFGADVICCESNHDTQMLMAGDYHDALKRRIAGPLGHLSNDDVASFLRKGLPGTSRVVLTHLSTEHNRPELARLSALDALEGRAELLVAGREGGLL